MRLPFAALAGLVALPVWAEPPQVVADIAPVHSLVAQVMAGVGEPALLLDGAADPHAVQLRPSQARLLQDADLVVWVGPELEPWLERMMEGFGSTESLALLDSPETHRRAFTISSEGDIEHPADEHAHEHGNIDPHAWLSADNAIAWLGLLAAKLSALDPENAGQYQANAQVAVTDLTERDTAIKARLAPFEGQEIVTFHDAFGYFADAYGIEVLGSVRPGDASTPSAAAVSNLRALVAEHGATCAFGEPGFDPALLQTLADETGLRTGILDTTGALLEAGPALYGEMMDALADEMVACFTN